MLNRKNKILLVLHIPPPYGGGEIGSLNVYKYFIINKNFKVVKISRKRGSKNSQGELKLRNILYSFYYVFRISYKILIYLPDKIYIGIPKDFLPFFRTSVVILFAKLFGVKVYAELAGTSFRFMDDEKKIRYKYGRYIFRRVDSIRLLGNNIVNYAKRIGFKNIKVFDNGIDIPFQYRINDDVIYKEILEMIYVGSLERLKGIYNIIECLKLCKENNLKFGFRFLGEWSNIKDKKKIEELIHKYKLENHITFCGLQIDDDKWKIYSQCALLVHPTFWDGQPISILEAMGLGLGIISTNIGAIPDTIINEDNGIILRENTPKNLYEAIKLLNNDRNLLKKMSVNNIKTYSARFTSSVFLQNFKEWIEE